MKIGTKVALTQYDGLGRRIITKGVIVGFVKDLNGSDRAVMEGNDGEFYVKLVGFFTVE